MHLQDIARNELPHAHDLHETHRLLADLTDYEHLHRLVRLCVVHVFRNIKKSKVPDTVKNDMRSLICIAHPNWEETLARIRHDGKAAGDRRFQ